MNLPNRLSMLRIILVPVMAVCFLLRAVAWWTVIVAIGLFLLAVFTDFLDGYIARKTNQVTDLGKLLDPTADKMLVCFSLFLLTEAQVFSQGFIPNGVGGFCCAIIICRELLIGIIRQIAATKGVVLAANMWGKVKATFQYISIPILMLLVPREQITLVSEGLYGAIYCVGMGLFGIATILTIISAVVYIVQNKSVFGARKND